MTIFLTVLCALIGYLAGAFPTGVWVSRAYGINIREHGSGNIGATNVLRAVGKFPALIVILADPLKAFLAVMLAHWLGLGAIGLAITGLCTLLGNNFNAFLGFRGGKGIATSLGAFLAIDPITALIALCLGVFTIALGRFVSLGSLVGALAMLLAHLHGNHTTLPTALLTLTMFLLAMVRHHENIGRLARGVERRLGEKATVNATENEGEGESSSPTT